MVAEMVVWRKTSGVYHNESAGINLQATIAVMLLNVAATLRTCSFVPIHGLSDPLDPIFLQEFSLLSLARQMVHFLTGFAENMSASFLQNKDVRNHVQQIYSNSLLAHTVMKCEFLKGRTMQATVAFVCFLNGLFLRLQMLPLSTTSKQYFLESTCIINGRIRIQIAYTTSRRSRMQCAFQKGIE